MCWPSRIEGGRSWQLNCKTCSVLPQAMDKAEEMIARTSSLFIDNKYVEAASAITWGASTIMLTSLSRESKKRPLILTDAWQALD